VVIIFAMFYFILYWASFYGSDDAENLKTRA
jgi:hypothetical protein